MSEAKLARDPGRLLPLLILTLLPVKGKVVTLPELSVNVNTELAPSSSVKK